MYTKLPPKGMRDFLPNQKRIRDEILSRINDAYISCGFTPIETSAIENLPNLMGGDGGENTQLIFKILKRGEKLNLNNEELADLGLRFDFTLPLTRFYSNNKNELPQVFKAVQTGYVYRGERPQKGRYRAFIQCDADIIGEPSNIAEIEIINAVIKALSSLGFQGFEIKISDRRFLVAIITENGFNINEVDDVCISLDKLDKIGKTGVEQELITKNFKKENIDRLLNAIESMNFDNIKDYNADSHENINQIRQAFEGKTNIVFEPTLVRGMGYYTGTIFEIFSNKYPLALGGGGRYDKMIGKISGHDAPGVGFSIGFERIFELIADEFETEKIKKTAIIVESSKKYSAALEEQNRIVEEGGIASIYLKKKKTGKQFDSLEKEGYEEFIKLF